MTIGETAGAAVDVRREVGGGEATRPDGEAREPFLVALGERVRSMRARKGMTRRSLALASSVSERHLANLESGQGNASILVLRQVAGALGCRPSELLDDELDAPERVLIRDLLKRRGDDELRRARLALSDLFGTSARPEARRHRIALVGLRGAGKSTLGRRLAADMGATFVELNREIERVAGYGLAEIHNLLGPSAYRRYERRALEEALEREADAVIATPGGIVSEPETFNLLLSKCFTVWLTASPDEHMRRVVAQGDLRPMAGNAEAMDDLKRILAGRAAFYGKADLTFETTGRSPDACYSALVGALALALGRPITSALA